MESVRELATVLFTDIVGSTEEASRLGDRQWRELLRLHNERVRAQLKRHDGREVNTVGDGFVATFDDPEQAIRCACAIRAAVAPLELAIKSGLHMGEIEREGREVGGIAVHIAARVSAQAGGGEVLVSSTIRELVAGSGFGFEDRGPRALKGVPGEWRLFAVTGEPARVQASGRWPTLRRRFPRVTPGRAILAGVAAFVLLAALSSLYFRDPGAERVGGPRSVIAAGAPLGIAVLPFSVTSPRLGDWRESMVTLLTTNLDGLGGLRAIDSRTVLARWREQVADAASPDLPTTLEVARRAGAEYALLGSVVSIGDRVRLSVDVYDVKTGAQLGHGQVDGGPDGVIEMVDRLSIRVLEVILEKDRSDLPGVNLASVTTDSIRALRAFLEGERAFRRSDFRAAIPHYARAVAIDSTFALALLRLGNAEWWSDVEVPAVHLQRAARLGSRLPEREALLVRAHLALQRGTLDGLEPLRTAVTRYPDDVEAWYFLGDTYFHLGAQALVDAEAAERALLRAVQLDPTFTPAHIHLVDLAFLRADSAAAAARVDAFGQLAPAGDYDAWNRLALVVAFGDSGARDRAIDSISAAGPPNPRVIADYLWHPRFGAIQERVLTAAPLPDGREGARVLVHLISNALVRGKLAAARRYLDHPRTPSELRGPALYAVGQLGGVVDPARLDRELGLAGKDSVPDLVGFYTGVRAVDVRREADAAGALAALRRTASERLAAGDSAGSRFADGALLALEGYRLWKEGRPDEALPLLQRAQRQATAWEDLRAEVNAAIRLWTADLLIDADRPRDAEPYLAARELEHALGWFWRDPLADVRLGELYSSIGEARRAREAYQKFLLRMSGADPELDDQVAHVRAALAELAPVGRDP